MQYIHRQIKKKNKSEVTQIHRVFELVINEASQISEEKSNNQTNILRLSWIYHIPG